MRSATGVDGAAAGSGMTHQPRLPPAPGLIERHPAVDLHTCALGRAPVHTVVGGHGATWMSTR